jgi:transposase-like protein
MTTQSGSNGSGAVPGKRRSKKFLSPSAKYEIWLQLVRGEVTISQAATTAGVDRSTILRIRTVTKEAAMAALAASKPGVGKTARDVELEEARAEVARLSEACKELAVKLTLVEGKVSVSSSEEARSGLKMGVRSPVDVVPPWSR